MQFIRPASLKHVQSCFVTGSKAVFRPKKSLTPCLTLVCYVKQVDIDKSGLRNTFYASAVHANWLPWFVSPDITITMINANLYLVFKKLQWCSGVDPGAGEAREPDCPSPLVIKNTWAKCERVHVHLPPEINSLFSSLKNNCIDADALMHTEFILKGYLSQILHWNTK